MTTFTASETSGVPMTQMRFNNPPLLVATQMLGLYLPLSLVQMRDPIPKGTGIQKRELRKRRKLNRSKFKTAHDNL